MNNHENDQIGSKIEFVSHQQQQSLNDLQLEEYQKILTKLAQMTQFNVSQSSSTSTNNSNYTQLIESLQNFDINNKNITDLQILQSVISRIHDLQTDLQSNS